ncbi:hypothetical protein [Patiriisocius sp. Uisw_017]|jgi:hypothetical protein|uniref:hypothetical protein n=1 Tax=Patiriisocius sp. Uisw_017 TaxID=3230968 RepID=UPI0039E78045
MKNLILSIFLVVPFLISAQAETYADLYNQVINTDDGVSILYSMELKKDGTFTFRFLRQLSKSQPKENKYAKGTWSIGSNNVLEFKTNTSEMDEKYTLNLNDTKARYISKSSRNLSKGEFPNYLQFYDSSISWVKSMKLVRNGYQ